MTTAHRLATISLLAAVAATAACNEAFIPDYNALTAFPHSVASLQNEMTGVLNAPRNNQYTDLFWFTYAAEGFARTGAYYTPSEDRFVTQYTGETKLDNDNFGARVWDNEFNAVKIADTVIGIIPTLTTNTGSAVSATDVAGLVGVLQTEKALFFMYLALSHDTVGVPMWGVGKAFTSPAPILCAPTVWKDIIAVLDSAVTDLTTAGSNTLGLTGTKFVMAFPSTYAGASVGRAGSVYTAASFMNLTLALRGRAHLENAYAIARASAGSKPTLTTPGSPDAGELNAAIADITASSLYSSALTPAEAVPANDIGVFHNFSPASGDVSNPIFGQAGATFILQQAASQIDTVHDARFLAKFAAQGKKNLPSTLPGGQFASDFTYSNNIGVDTPLPIVRNVELQFLLARAYLGLGNYLKAAQIVDAVRTNVGGLASGLPGVNVASYTSVRDFLVREQLPSLAFDGTGDQIVTLRDLSLAAANDITWGAADTKSAALHIPVTESDGRNGSTACVNQ
jgi:hypothetical protein